MTEPDCRADFLERARMHDRLASATHDPEARRMHQAMAAEYRRRSGQGGWGDPPPVQRPTLELHP
jgi:hypothetical protein